MQTTANSIKLHPTAQRVRAVVRLVSRTVASLVVVGAVTWMLAAAWLSARADIEATGPAAADELLGFGAASLALAIAAWLVLATVLEVLSHVPGRVGAIAQAWSARLSPALARRVAAFVVGVGVGVAGGPTQAVAGPRAAASASESASASASFTASPIADPGFLPSTADLDVPEPGFRPAAATTPPGPGFTPAAPRVRPQADPSLLGARVPTTTTTEVVVHRGDSLWSIAARHLGPQASDAEIAQAWPQWFDLNRDVIGDDPDLILPGQILRAPGAEQTASVTR